MTRTLTAALLIAAPMLQILAQAPSDQKALIKEMCGCYEVTFQYAETFTDNPNYQIHEPYSARGLEWIFVDEESPEQLVLQHLLIVGESTVVKHWRQDWLYENTELLTYVKNLEWQKSSISPEQARGTWTQKVWQVDESPRYQGYATWNTLDGGKSWESQVYAPLPRREYTKRSDYNVMLRNNHHRITASGHVHELDNAKLIRHENGDSVLVWEKGMNQYVRVPDERCRLAADWWKDHAQFWRDVRTEWKEIVSSNDYINLSWKIDGERLHSRIFAFQNEILAENSYSSEEVRGRVKEIGRASCRERVCHRV